MNMKALFAQNQTLENIRQDLQTAMQNNDQEKVSKAFSDMFQYYSEVNRQDYEELKQERDVQVLAARGVRQLTAKEREYYQKLGGAMKSDDPRQAVTGLDVVMPETVIDSVFDDLLIDHPILRKIRFMNTKGAIRMMMNTNGYQEAVWGKLCAPIVQELSSGFKEVETGLYKLSAFIPVCKAMLDLGPEWLDRYVRMILQEALANGMEKGVVDGDGKDSPVGMTRQVGDNVTITGGVYPRKTPIKVTSFSPAIMGKLTSILAVSPNGNPRRVNDLILLVNPQDYFEKVVPATTFLAPDGTYRRDVLPVPAEIAQTIALSRGEAVYGIASLYYAFAGMNKNGKIEYSDDYHFLEDERLYLSKTYANGMPADNNAFLLLDISELQPALWKVTMVEETTPSTDATLSDLKLGSLALSPAFSGSVVSYTTETSNETNTINAVPSSASASVKVTVNGAEVNNGSAAKWQTGSNTVLVEVTAEDETTAKTYTVAVTKTAVSE